MVEITPIQFNYQSLSDYYSSGAAMGLNLHAARLREGALKDLIDLRGEAVIPPWRVDTVAENTLAQRALSDAPLIDKSDPLFARDDTSDDIKNLFTIWKALERMKDEANFSKTLQGRSLATILDRQFQAHVADLTEFVNGTTFQGLNLVTGRTTDSLRSTITLDQIEKQPRFLGQVVVNTRTDAVPGLTTADQFTIDVTKSGTTTTSVTIDLGNVTGTLNLDNIVDYTNTQLLAAGVSTTFNVERYSETEYGVRIEHGYDEAVSLTAAAATDSGAVYFAGDRGTGIYGGAFVSKLNDLGAADPVEEFYNGIDAPGGDDSAKAVAVDSAGGVYVVGTTAGELQGQADVGSNDAFLQKYDAGGNLVWTQKLGAQGDAGGFAVAVDSGDNVIVTGQTSTHLVSNAYGGNYDTFVTKFDSKGTELWTRQAGPYVNDSGLAITVDSSDNIFIAGRTYSAIATDQTHGGGSDAFLTKLDSDGVLQYNKQFGDAGTEKATGVAVNNSGDVFIVGEDDGNGFLIKYADNSTSTPTYTQDLGALGTDGAVTGIAVDSKGDLYISGTTTNAALDNKVKNAHSGGLDGFVLSVNDKPSSVTIDWVTYVGTTATDEGFSVTVDPSNDDFFLSGATAGTLAGETGTGSGDGFVAKFDKNGNLGWTHQFNGGFANAANGIAFDADGTNVLSRLGLPEGTVPPDISDNVTAVSATRPGAYFYVSVDDDKLEKIEVENDDSFGFLAFKIRRAIGALDPTKGNSIFVDDDIEGRYLKIQALNGHKIQVFAGGEGLDALKGLGLKETVLFGEPPEGDTESPANNAFGLGLTSDMNITAPDKADDALVLLENAQRIIRKAYKLLTKGPEEEDIVPPGRASTLTLKRLAAYQDALSRLQNTNPVDVGAVPSLI